MLEKRSKMLFAFYEPNLFISMKLNKTLKKIAGILSLFFLPAFFSLTVQSQIITSDPILPTDQEVVHIYFDATGTNMEGYDGNVYAHTGVNIEGVGNWQHVIGGWGDNSAQPQLEKIDDDFYLLEITPNIRDFYSVPEDEIVTGLAFVFRAEEESPQSQDLFVDVFEAGVLSISILNPPKTEPIVEHGESIEILAAAIDSDEINLYIDNEQVSNTTESQITYVFDSSDYGYGTFWVKATATSGEESVSDSTYLFVRPEPVTEELPGGLIPGINYLDDNTVTLVLHDPPAAKEFVFAIGDFNDWMVTEDHYMKRTPDGTHYWITISDLTADQEYGFQYFIDNEIRLADPYTHKILDPWNDPYLDEFTYPNLKEYPSDKTDGYVSIMHPGREPYQWEVTDFTPPAPEDMVVYELLIRDFVETSAIKTVMDSLDYLQNLGVNVIELMPVNQFEGNISWGYNPATYFATDKAYGTREDYKKFIDECHKRGIAVVLDIVLNHSFNLSPMVQMYFDPDAGNWGQPSPENPWYLEECPHEPWCWGQTFDQDSPHVHEFFDRVTEYWLTEFKVDGFRFDFTKGFTNEQSEGDGWQYDQARIDNLKRIADHMWSINPDAYVILEHFTENSEEKELAEYDMLIWGNITHAYHEAAMGWIDNSNFDWISHINRGWDVPHLVGYMESHDEERIMYRNQMYGNAGLDYDIQQKTTALERSELLAAFYFTIPGPKMIWQFGELGYDYSINHCGNAPVDPIPGNIDEDDPGRCRTDPKPIRWDYYDDWRRKRLYDVYAMLIDLKKEYDVFRTDDYTLALGGENKRIHLNHESGNVTIVGNFGVTENTFNPNFQHTGTWYEFFSRETLEVEDLSDPITLQPGEYRLYSTQEFPDHGVSLSADNLETENQTSVQVFPNPSDEGFNFRVPDDNAYHLQIINLKGQVVFENRNAFGPGQSEFFWNSNLSNGAKASPGLYFYNIYTKDDTLSGKIMVR